MDQIAVLGVVSRKVHGSAGTFDLPLALTGSPTVESRSSGGAHTIVVNFNNPVVSGSASVTEGIGGVGSASFSGNTMTIDLTGVGDAQKITIKLSGVTGTASQVMPDTTVSMNVLAGDVNQSKAVGSADVGQVKSLVSTPVNATNFLSDVVVSGAINATDVSLVKSRSGAIVP